MLGGGIVLDVVEVEVVVEERVEEVWVEDEVEVVEVVVELGVGVVKELLEVVVENVVGEVEGLEETGETIFCYWPETNLHEHQQHLC